MADRRDKMREMIKALAKLLDKFGALAEAEAESLHVDPNVVRTASLLWTVGITGLMKALKFDPSSPQMAESIRVADTELGTLMAQWVMNKQSGKS